MRRSLQVAAPLLATTALALTTGCRRPEMQRCVDENNRVVDDSLCKNLPNQQPPGGGYHGGGFVPVFPYHYYYGGLGGYGLGSIVSGGSTAPIAGHSYANASTSRGGFGSSRGGGGGSGEGGGGE